MPNVPLLPDPTVYQPKVELLANNQISHSRLAETQPMHGDFVHIRYALRVGSDQTSTKFVGHSGGCQGTPIGDFEHARIWARRQDAVNYMKHPNVAKVRSKLEVADVTCCIGRPFAIFTEK